MNTTLRLRDIYNNKKHETELLCTDDSVLVAEVNKSTMRYELLRVIK